MVKDKSAYKHVRISLELWRRTKVACVGVEEGIGAFAERAIEERLRGMVEGSISGGRKVVEVGWKPPASLPSKVSESRGSLAEANEAIVEALPEVRAGLRESDARVAAAVGVAEATFAPTLGGEVPVRERAEVLKDFHVVEHEGDFTPIQTREHKGLVEVATLGGEPVPADAHLSPLIEWSEGEPVPPSEPTLSPYDYCYLCRQVMMPGEVVAVRPGGRAHRRCQAVVDLTTDSPASPSTESAESADVPFGQGPLFREPAIRVEPRAEVGPKKDELF